MAAEDWAISLRSRSGNPQALGRRSLRGAVGGCQEALGEGGGGSVGEDEDGGGLGGDAGEGVGDDAVDGHRRVGGDRHSAGASLLNRRQAKSGPGGMQRTQLGDSEQLAPSLLEVRQSFLGNRRMRRPAPRETHDRNLLFDLPSASSSNERHGADQRGREER